MKVVFIINSIQNQRCTKRVEEFVNQGYTVDAYAFSRNVSIPIRKTDTSISIVGEYSNDIPYKKRVLILYDAIKDICKKNKSEDVIYYLFGLDIAMVFCLISRRKYIYEESDLVHTYVDNFFVKNILEIIDRRLINKSLLSVFTSQGFVNFHFPTKQPLNIHVIPNRLHPSILNFPILEKRNDDVLRIGFVGFPRFNAVINFIKVFLANFPDAEFHLFGALNEKNPEFEKFESYDNFYAHGPFKTPDDLPSIYSQIDIVLSTYDTEFINVRYAEPNKLYEAIYFNTPIIVSTNTFLEEQVIRYEAGWGLNAMDDNSVIEFVKSLNKNMISDMAAKILRKDKRVAINDNTIFFLKLKKLLNKIPH